MGLPVLIAACLLVEALLTGSEMVFVAMDRHRLQERAKRGERGAALALRLLARPDRALATTLTGTNLFIVLGAVATTSHFLSRFGEGGKWISVAVLTPLVILFGEVVPKGFAQPRADRLAGAAAKVIRVAEVLLFPLVMVVAFLARLLSRPFGGVPPLQKMVTRDELTLILQASRGRTDVEAHERVMVRRVFDFGEKRVGDIFRPLAQVAVLPEDASCRDAARLVARSGHTRYPVFRDRVDQVTGFLHVLDTVGRAPEEPILPLLRKALFVPELMPVDELMRKFQEASTSFAVVVDEYGGVTGIVTAEDVVEEVVGEIEDEHDRGMEYYKKLARDEFEVPGWMETSRLSEEMGIRFPEGDYATVGGMLTSLAGRIPAPGESFPLSAARFTVLESSERAVLKVRIRLEGRETGEQDWEGGLEEPGWTEEEWE